MSDRPSTSPIAGDHRRAPPSLRPERPMQRQTHLPAVAIILLLLVTGCTELTGVSALKLPWKSSEDKIVDNVKAALSGSEGYPRTIGEYVTVRRGLQMFVVEGIGLVTGLNGTGTDDGPPHRDTLLEEMRKRRFPRPEEFLRSPNTAIVLVRAYIPPLARKGDPLDVEVRVPDGSGATSLRGGSLLECSLSEIGYVQGRGRMEGHVMAKARGPILNTKLGDSESSGDFLRGQIPGGAVYIGPDRDMSIALKPEYSNYRMSTRIAKRIGERFHDYDKSGIQRPLAEAKTHSRIDLQIHSRYRDNYPRYLQVIRNIQLRDSTINKNLRMQQLGEQLIVGPTAAVAALQLEAIGREGIPYLKAGLKADNLESRFYAAEALAYLGETAGVATLREAADKEPAFRVFALAALSATSSPEATIELQQLLNHESVETRYGAFRAIANIYPDDPSICPVRVQGGYHLHVVQSESTPVVHLSQRRRAELVLFGADQCIQTPCLLRAGRYILIRSVPTGDRLIVTYIAPGEPERRQEVSTRLVDLLRAVDEYGARYPEVVQMIVEAHRQGNLAGRLGIDELPQAGRTYTRPGFDDAAAVDEAPVGVGETPNLFDAADPSQNAVEGPVDPEEPETAEALGNVGFVVQ